VNLEGEGGINVVHINKCVEIVVVSRNRWWLIYCDSIEMGEDVY